MSAHRQRDVENQQIPLNDIRDPHAHWREIFREYDRDRDGRICIRELQAIIRSPEYRIGDIPDTTIRQIMDFSDRDNSGYLDEEEFIEMILHPAHRHIFQNMMQKYIKLIVPGRGHADVTEVDRISLELQDFEVIQDQRNVPSQDYVYDGLYEQQYSCWPPAVCMIIVSVVEVILFLYDALVEQNKSGTGPIATQLIYNPYKRYEAWRFISYMFVHIGSVHLVVNLFVQLLLGIPLEMVHCWWRVLLVYLAGVVAGSLGTSVTDPSVFLAGASGGVYALITAHLATLFMNWSEIEYAIIQLLVFICIIATDVGTAVYNRYYSGLDQSIGYVAHLAGAIAGLLVGIGVLRNLEVKSWEKKLWWCAVVTYFVLMTAAVFINIFWTDHFPAPRPDYK